MIRIKARLMTSMMTARLPRSRRHQLFRPMRGTGGAERVEPRRVSMSRLIYPPSQHVGAGDHLDDLVSAGLPLPASAHDLAAAEHRDRVGDAEDVQEIV